jgi:hypothetical protein
MVEMVAPLSLAAVALVEVMETSTQRPLRAALMAGAGAVVVVQQMPMVLLARLAL